MAEDELLFEGIKEWEEQTHHSHITLPEPPWSMVVVKAPACSGDFSVFPPINHENLHISSRQNQELEKPSLPPPPSPSLSSSSSSSSSSFSSSDIDGNGLDSPPPRMSKPHSQMIPGDLTRSLRIGIGILLAKLRSFASSFRFSGAIRGGLRSFGPAAGMAAVALVWWFWMRFRWRRRDQRMKMDQLMHIIKENNEKIMQLLHRILEMNEALLVRQGSSSKIGEFMVQG